MTYQKKNFSCWCADTTYCSLIQDLFFLARTQGGLKNGTVLYLNCVTEKEAAYLSSFGYEFKYATSEPEKVERNEGRNILSTRRDAHPCGRQYDLIKGSCEKSYAAIFDWGYFDSLLEIERLNYVRSCRSFLQGGGAYMGIFPLSSELPNLFSYFASEFTLAVAETRECLAPDKKSRKVLIAIFKLID